MVNVIGVRFQNAGKLYFFDPGQLWPTPGDFVVVETSRGIEFGEVVTSVQGIDDGLLQSPLKKVVRIASMQDMQHAKDNKVAEKEAYAICQKKIGEHKLDMKLVSVEYTFDNSKLLFYFTANGRVDFRSLVKDLASIFKTRIELRQIGVRDEAKMLGGLGPCGRSICCGTFLGDFQPVSIKMAKEQNLSLNPIKISGVCGRLMCCLKYEQENYEQTRKRMPRVGREVLTPDGVGVVVDLNIIKETVRVRMMKGDNGDTKDYPVAELQRVQQEQQSGSADGEAQPQTDAAPGAPEKRPEHPAKERQRTLRSGGEQHTGHRERTASASHMTREETAVQLPNQTNEEQQAPSAPVKPVATPERNKTEGNPWKDALERAMRAAEGDEKDEGVAPLGDAAQSVEVETQSDKKDAASAGKEST